MDLSGKEGKIGYDFEDETYYFCSELCKDHFAKEPKNTPRRLNEKGRPNGSPLRQFDCAGKTYPRAATASPRNLACIAWLSSITLSRFSELCHKIKQVALQAHAMGSMTASGSTRASGLPRVSGQAIQAPPASPTTEKWQPTGPGARRCRPPRSLRRH